jgi:hypothetical protein
VGDRAGTCQTTGDGGPVLGCVFDVHQDKSMVGGMTSRFHAFERNKWET